MTLALLVYTDRCITTYNFRNEQNKIYLYWYANITNIDRICHRRKFPAYIKLFNSFLDTIYYIILLSLGFLSVRHEHGRFWNICFGGIHLNLTWTRKAKITYQILLNIFGFLYQRTNEYAFHLSFCQKLHLL